MTPKWAAFTEIHCLIVSIPGEREGSGAGGGARAGRFTEAGVSGRGARRNRGD